MLSCTGSVITGVNPLTLLRVERLHLSYDGGNPRSLLVIVSRSVRTGAKSVHGVYQDRISFLIYQNNTEKQNKNKIKGITSVPVLTHGNRGVLYI